MFMPFKFASAAHRAGLAGALALMLAAPLAAQEADAVVATVNDVEITEEQVALATRQLAETLREVPEAGRRDYVVSYLVDLELLAQAADSAGLAEEEEFAQRMEYLRQRLITEVYLERVGEEAVTDEAMRELYDAVIAQAGPEIEIRASHILVETEEEAREVVAELGQDADFAELATERSQDPGSAQRGGDLGYFVGSQMVPQFAEAAEALEVGETSEPVESQYGWHVIRLEDRRERPAPEFEQLAGELRTVVMRRAQRDRVLELRDAADIEIRGAGAEPGGEAPAESAPPALDGGPVQ